jgi:hypothetical protein
MRITLNLSPPASAHDRYALVWAVPATVLGLAALIFLGRASLREYRDYRGIQRQVVEVETRLEDLRRQEADLRRKLDDPASRDLLHHARFVNDLITQREFSLANLSARIAGLLPEDARLTGLALSAPKKPGDDYLVRIGINARNEDVIEMFINDLEDAPDFKDVSILNQGFEEEAAQGGQIDITCTARFLPAMEQAIEDATQAPPAGSEKAEAEGQEPEAQNQKTRGKTQEPVAGSQKPE